MKHFRLGLILLTIVSSSVPKTQAIEFTDEEAGIVTQTVGVLLSRYHFRSEELSETKSQIFLDNYLERLDPRRMIFLKSDIDGFQERYGKRLPLLTMTGNAEPGFNMYDIYLERIAQVSGYVDGFLDGEMDLTANDYREADRSEQPWPSTEEERKTLWEKRIKDEYLTSVLNGDEEEEIVSKLKKRYDRFVKRMEKYDSSDVLQVYLSSLGHSYDPHSGYMSPAEAEDFDIENITLEFSGIGATLREEDGYTKIISLVPGGPAEGSGQLSPGDRIIEVAQGDQEPVDVVETKLRDVVDLIRGPINSEVRLTIEPADGGEKKVVSIVRDRIELEDQLARAMVVETPGLNNEYRRFGVIDLPQFYGDCSDHVEALLTRLKKENVEGVVLDLSRNSGGLLDEAVQIAGLFVKDAPVVAIKDILGNVEVKQDADSSVAYDGPLVVHVDRLSASASEIVAAALQDYERAVVVGTDATHGKGTVQTVTPLEKTIPKRRVATPGSLKFTVQKFYRVSGISTQKIGVTPDIKLPSIYDHMDWVGEANLDNALPSDEIELPSVDYPEFGLVNRHIGALRKNSKERVDANPEFQYVLEEIDRLKTKRELDRVSLNLETRRAEEDEDEARKERREKERLSREPNGRRVFRLTVEAAENNGPLEPLTVDDLREELTQARFESGQEENADDEDRFIPLLNHYLAEAINTLADYADRLKAAGQLVASKETDRPALN